MSAGVFEVGLSLPHFVLTFVFSFDTSFQPVSGSAKAISVDLSMYELKDRD
jgi:hypothetical protein